MNAYFSPSTPQGMLLLLLRSRLERAQASSQRGASAMEFVIITAVLVALAAAVGLIIYNMVEGKANEIQIPDTPGGNP
jgi:flagellar basal body-associated protein FliL